MNNGNYESLDICASSTLGAAPTEISLNSGSVTNSSPPPDQYWPRNKLKSRRSSAVINDTSSTAVSNIHPSMGDMSRHNSCSSFHNRVDLALHDHILNCEKNTSEGGDNNDQDNDGDDLEMSRYSDERKVYETQTFEDYRRSTSGVCSRSNSSDERQMLLPSEENNAMSASQAITGRVSAYPILANSSNDNISSHNNNSISSNISSNSNTNGSPTSSNIMQKTFYKLKHFFDALSGMQNTRSNIHQSNSNGFQNQSGPHSSNAPTNLQKQLLPAPLSDTIHSTSNNNRTNFFGNTSATSNLTSNFIQWTPVSAVTATLANCGATTIAATYLVSSMTLFHLLFGTAGIFVTYLYYGDVQEDLFRYRDPKDNSAFTYVWYLQMAESSVTILLGFAGRIYSSTSTPLVSSSNSSLSASQSTNSYTTSTTAPVGPGAVSTNSTAAAASPTFTKAQQQLPTWLFFQSGTCQLLGKALMALSLAAGLSFPVVVLAKSAKVVPVMLGQCALGGSSYHFRDYLFAILIVVGTALLSFGSKTTASSDVDESIASDRDTSLGLFLITLSLVMDGITGGLQKKLKRETAGMVVTAYDFLFYSHIAMFTVSMVISLATGELSRGHLFVVRHLNSHNTNGGSSTSTNIIHLLVASCLCSAVGQCFIFYVIAKFDPLVCTTITTTRKMASVMYSITFKGHQLSFQGVCGLILGLSALVLEIEKQVAKNSNKKSVSSLSPPTTTAASSSSTTPPLSTTDTSNKSKRSHTGSNMNNSNYHTISKYFLNHRVKS